MRRRFPKFNSELGKLHRCISRLFHRHGSEGDFAIFFPVVVVPEREHGDIIFTGLHSAKLRRSEPSVMVKSTTLSPCISETRLRLNSSDFVQLTSTMPEPAVEVAVHGVIRGELIPLHRVGWPGCCAFWIAEGDGVAGHIFSMSRGTNEDAGGCRPG